MDRHEMVSLYAKAGLWYDALRALGSADLRDCFTLLKDLAKLEEPEATQVQSGQSVNLRQNATVKGNKVRSASND